MHIVIHKSINKSETTAWETASLPVASELEPALYTCRHQLLIKMYHVDVWCNVRRRIMSQSCYIEFLAECNKGFSPF